MEQSQSVEMIAPVEGVIEVGDKNQEGALNRRQSQRVKDQCARDLKVADKAGALKANKNKTYITQSTSRNSFATLSSDSLISLFNSMGVNTSIMDCDRFDILWELEKARSNLEERIGE